MDEANDTEGSLRGILDFVFDRGRMIPIIPQPGFPVQSPFQRLIYPFMRIERGAFQGKLFWRAPKNKSARGVCDQRERPGSGSLSAAVGGFAENIKHLAVVVVESPALGGSASRLACC